MTTRRPAGTTSKPPGVDTGVDTSAGKVAAAGRPDASTPATAGGADADVAAFIAKMKTVAAPVSTDRGRLLFAMDATMSRAPTWDMALSLQGEMFAAVKEVGGLDVQLVYFRGMGECRASKWVSDPDGLARLMRSVACQGGLTQIGKVLSHALDASRQRRINAVVYVGDSMEEDVDHLCARAGELALLGVPVFVFQEGGDETAARAFREIARLTKGAFCRFDRGSARQLRDLLTAVATFAAGGRKALLALGSQKHGAGARLLLEQLTPGASGA
ncbi:MAG: VWA domain-containing protein [Hyphomicrobium sp.]|jgi:hypothetical protein